MIKWYFVSPKSIIISSYCQICPLYLSFSQLLVVPIKSFPERVSRLQYFPSWSKHYPLRWLFNDSRLLVITTRTLPGEMIHIHLMFYRFILFFIIDQFLIKMIAEIKVKGNFSVVKEAHHNYFCFSSFRFNFHRSSQIKKCITALYFRQIFQYSLIYTTQSHQRTSRKYTKQGKMK